MKAHADAARLLIAGTSRTPVPAQAALAQSAPAALAALLARVGEGASDEARLWRTLAALDWTRRAGFKPAAPAGAPAVQFAPPDRLAAPSPQAEALLHQMLTGVHAQLIMEWLMLAARHGRRLPHGLLPSMLELGAKQAALRASITAVADERGRWLAAHNPRWQYVLNTAVSSEDPATLQRLWETAEPGQRIAALQRWREIAPDAARAALEASWKTEAPETRAKMLPVLATGLAPADEAFLEAALDDKRKDVRIAAEDLLLRLPGSALISRMKERVAALVKVESRLLLGKKLGIELPQDASKPMQRDGIGRDKQPNLGEKAGWLADMLAALPPGYWSTLLDTTPEKALEHLLAHEHHNALLAGITAACLRNPAAAPAWTRLLMALWIKDSKRWTPYYAADFPAALLALPPAQADLALQEWVRASSKPWHDDEPMLMLLARTIVPGRPWSRALSLLVIERMGASRKAMNQPYSVLRNLTQHYAFALDAASGPDYEAQWPAPAPDDVPNYTRMRDDFLAITRKRHELHLSFTGEPHGQ